VFIYHRLTYLGFEVEHVCNLTDIDDKILERIRKEGVTHEELTSRYL
jgi:cysteinyl-tRNA synthetase